MDDFHSPAQEWSYRVPSPPRIYVPPPLIQTCTGAPAVPFDQYLNLDFKSTGFDNNDFLKTVTYDNFIPTHAMTYWKYESRRNAQQVLPFLFLGPITAARDRNFLESQGITMLLAVRDIRVVHARLLGSKAAVELGIPCSTVDTSGNQELIGQFPHGIEIINAHLSEVHKQNQNSSISGKTPAPGKVLVFCETGNERSAAMVAAYLMAMYSMDFVKAIQIIHAQRFSVAFDDSLRHLLQTFDCILQAKRDVIHSGQQRGGATANGDVGSSSTPIDREILRKHSKRTLDETYEDDVDMDAEADRDDVARFARREGAAPFLDDAGS
ncbi:MAG: hypothetical protein Q9199_005669 [Rusavskia elegans]